MRPGFASQLPQPLLIPETSRDVHDFIRVLEIVTLACALDRSRGIASKHVSQTQPPSLQKQVCSISDLIVRGGPV
jgi:hypothetical protein